MRGFYRLKGLPRRRAFPQAASRARSIAPGTLRGGDQPVAEGCDLRGVRAGLRRHEIKSRSVRQRHVERRDEASFRQIGLDIGGAADGDAEPVDGRLHGHEDQVEAQARLALQLQRQARGREPEPPVVVVACVVQQRVMREVFRLAQRMRPPQQRGTAHGENLVGHQPVGAHAGPLSAAVADRRVDVVARKIDQSG
jgi:hypothetical protein